MGDETIMIMSRDEPRPALAALIAASFVRDDVPWLYEIAAETYRLSVMSDPEAKRRAFTSFMRACEIAARGPMDES